MPEKRRREGRCDVAIVKDSKGARLITSVIGEQSSSQDAIGRTEEVADDGHPPSLVADKEKRRIESSCRYG